MTRMEGNINYKSISCENIPENFLDKLIAKKHFSKFGKINRFIFCPKRLSCTVEYEKEDDAQNALENAGDYNGYQFPIQYSRNETAHTQNTEEWVDPEVQAELDAMGSNLIRNSQQINKQQPQQQRMRLFAPPPPSLSSSISSTSSSSSSSTPSSSLIGKQLKSILKPATMNTITKMPGIAVMSTMASTALTSSSGGNQSTCSSATAKASMASVVETPKIDINTKQELEMILRKQALDAEDKFKILDARDKLIRLKTVRTTDIKKAESTRGTCPDMCPEKERLLREAKHQVSSFEMNPDSGVMDHKYAIKRYSRSSADQEVPLAHELRPEPVLKMTMMYLMKNIMNLCDNTVTRDSSSQLNLGDWFHFVWDRTRSVRKDITQQDLCSLGTVKLIEQCARFHIHCAARLIAEDPSVFDQKINTENLTKCLQTLKYMYHDLRLKNIQCPNEPEFRSYVILLNLNDCNFLWELKQLPDNVQQSKEISEAIAFYLAVDSHDYVKFFKLIKTTTYMNACILLRYFNQVRDMAIRIIMKAYYSPRFYTMPLEYLKNILAFESNEDLISFLNHYGLTCDNAMNRVLLDKTAFYEPEIPYSMDRTFIVESKLKISVGEAICGEKFESPLSTSSELSEINFETYIPHDSFDEYGYLKEEAWTAEDQNYEIKIKRSTQQPQNIYTQKKLTFGSSEDSGLFKIPKSSPTISSKQQQTQQQQKTPSLFDPVPLKPSDSIDTTRPVIAFGSKITSNDNQPLFNLPPFKESSSTISFSTKSTNEKVLFDQKPSSTPFFQMNKLSDSSKQETETVGSGFTKFSFSSPITSSVFGDKKTSNYLPLFSSENSIFKNKPMTMTTSEKEFTVNQFNFGTEKEKLEQTKDINEEMLRKKQIEKEKEIERKKFEEKQKIKEEKENRKKRLKQIEISSKEIYNEFLQNIIVNEIENVIKYENLISLSCKLQNEILEEIITNEINKILDHELTIAILDDLKLLKKYFYIWKHNVEKIKYRRKLIDSSPLWITDINVNEIAQNYSHSKLNETIGMMKRYRLGISEINLNSNQINYKKFNEYNNKIDLFKLFLNVLENEFKLNNNILCDSYGLLKKKFYFKCIISLTESEKTNINDIEYYENSKGFYEYMIKNLQNILLNNKQILSHNNNKEFFCECKNQIYICLREIHGIQPKNECNEKIITTNELNNINSIIFIMTTMNLHMTKKRLNNLLSRINNNNKNLLQLQYKIPLSIIIYNNNSIIDFDDIKNYLNLDNLLNDYSIISNYQINEFNDKNNDNNMNLNNILINCFKFLFKSSLNNNYEKFNKNLNILEMQKLITFLYITIGDEYWKRLKQSTIINPIFNEFCKKSQNVIDLYNIAIDKLIECIEKDLNDYPEFPDEFRKFIINERITDDSIGATEGAAAVSVSSSMSGNDSFNDINDNNNLPREIEYFPFDWKLYQTEKIYRIKNFLLKCKLLKFTTNDNDDDINEILKSIQQINDRQKLEKLLLNYTNNLIPIDKNLTKKIAYSVLKIIYDHLNNHMDFNDFIWIDCIRYIALELMKFMWETDSKYMPNHIIYDKSLINDFINIPWWLKLKSLATIKIDPESLLLSSSASVVSSSSSLSLSAARKLSSTSAIDEQNFILIDNDNNEKLMPNSKRIKYDNGTNNLIGCSDYSDTFSNNTDDLNDLFEKSYAILDKTEKNIKKYHQLTEYNRNLSKNLDLEFYYQEKINYGIKKLLNENKM